MAILGSGVQACTQLEAVCCVRDIQTVWVYSPNPDHRSQFAEQVAGRHSVPHDVRVTSTAREAVRQADVVCTATTSAIPVFDDIDLRPGTHINAVGSYQPHVQEIPDETIRRAKILVDHGESAWSETGDLLQPLDRGVMSRDHVHADLGEVVLGHRKGRESPDEVTLFKSVGLAVQDAAAARVAVRAARERGLGTVIDWTS